MKRKLNLLIVDDSVAVRFALKNYLLKQPSIANVVTATNGKFASLKLSYFRPDAIILDLEMPEMNGLEFLKFHHHRNLPPVIVFSSHSQRGARVTFKALHLGALDFLPKPKELLPENMDRIGQELMIKIEAAATSNKMAPRAVSAYHNRRHRNSNEEKSSTRECDLILIGASTGGPIAVETILKQCSPPMPPIVVAIHMPEGFTQSYAERLNQTSSLSICEAQNNQKLSPNTIFVCPGGQQTIIRKGTDCLYFSIFEEKKRVFHPTIDLLFESVSRLPDHKSCAILLTGMGTDGAKGLKFLADAGHHTIAQDRESSVVWGMPKAAIEMQAAREVLSLDQIAQRLKHKKLRTTYRTRTCVEVDDESISG